MKTACVAYIIFAIAVAEACNKSLVEYYCSSKDSNLRYSGHESSTLSTEPRYLMVKSDILEFTKIYVGI